LGQAIIVMLGVTVIAYLLVYLPNSVSPNTVIETALGPHATKPLIKQFNHQNHFDRSFFVQYWYFLREILHGNLGHSFKLSESTDAIIKNDAPRDVVLGGISLILSLVIAIPVGIVQAVKRNKAADYVGTTVSFILYSMPQYAVALILIQLLSISVHVFPATEVGDPTFGQMFTHPNQIILPIASLTIVTYAYFSRYMRSSAIDTLTQDFIRTARAKGLPEYQVLRKHLLRNSLLTVVTLVGLSIPVIITGTVITEAVFNFPGLGYEYLQASVQDDYQVMLGITVIIGLVTVLGNLLADVCYALIDPRVRY
jgi:peptide/nickel transport system permease protein